MNVAKLTLSVPLVLVSKGKRVAQMCGAYRLPKGKTEGDLKFDYLMEKHVHD
jgi:hypothetical protein